MLWRCPSVRFIDFEKVKDAERKQAAVLFGTAEEPTDLASKIMGIKSRTFDSALPLNGALSSALPTRMSRIKLTDKEKKLLEAKYKIFLEAIEIQRRWRNEMEEASQ